MIIVKLQGGLGNQMFQYAFGKAMSVNLSKDLYFDCSFFQNKVPNLLAKRNYELNLFSFIVKASDTKMHLSFTEPNLSQRVFDKLKLKKKLVYKEGSLEFTKSVFNISANVYLDGYWQSELYFESIRNQIRKDFNFKNPFNNGSKLIADDLLKEVNSVSIHIRRGDYISSVINNQVHGACSIDYYKRAIWEMSNQTHEPSYYFFSDEPKWVEQNLVSDLTNYTIVKHNQGADSWQDMALMSKCKHHIIANSSFSWWGAWLNPSPNKIVIAPKNWFAKPDLNQQSETLIPGNWIRI